ncbi:MAG: choline-sulfatase, partial [Gammaproteobacteria bacterium]
DLEAQLRDICDPEAVDARAKNDQRNRVQQLGGNEVISKMGGLTRTPPPGAELQLEETG